MYTVATKLPSLHHVQWSTPSAPNPALSAPLPKGQTTIYFTTPLYDYTATKITGNVLIGVKNSDSYVETMYIGAGGIAGDGLSATVVRGIRLEGLDYTTGDSTLEEDFNAGDAVFCNISGIIQDLVEAAVKGTIATGGTNITLGTEGGAGSETITLYRTTTAGAKLGFMRWYMTSGKVQFSDDGVTWVNNSDVSASDLVKISATDTTAGYLNDKVTVSNGSGAVVTKSITSPAGNEKLNIDVALNVATSGVDDHLIYTPAYLTGGNSAQATYTNWLAVLDGAFQITINGTPRSITGINFTGVTSMNDVATKIQTAIRALTSSTETVAWSTNHFVITSALTTSSSAITVTTAGASGTDISGAGASNWMDCDVGNGTVTVTAVNRAADAGKAVLIDSSGNIKSTLMEANLREADTFFGSTNITAAEAETLTASAASNADALHTHTNLVVVTNTGQTTRAAATGSGDEVTAHGLGKTPRQILFFAVSTSTASCMSNGCTDDGRASTCVYLKATTTGSGSGSDCIRLDDNAGNSQTATVSAWDATNFTLSWTKGGSGVATYVTWIALA